MDPPTLTEPKQVVRSCVDVTVTLLRLTTNVPFESFAVRLEEMLPASVKSPRPTKTVGRGLVGLKLPSQNCSVPLVVPLGLLVAEATPPAVPVTAMTATAAAITLDRMAFPSLAFRRARCRRRPTLAEILRRGVMTAGDRVWPLG